MKRTFHPGSAVILVLALALALAGCGAQQRSGSPAASADSADSAPSASSAPGTVLASQPNKITELTDQQVIYECAKCGMMFDGPGHCTMDGAELYTTKVTYFCPADKLPVNQMGRCPRCQQNARVMKAKMQPGGIKVEYVN